jgi:uncharacterized protein YjiS (DUF1127 family)
MTHSPALLVALGTIAMKPVASLFPSARAHPGTRKERRDYELLLLADDRILEDIGVTREEVRRALLDCDHR